MQHRITILGLTFFVVYFQLVDRHNNISDPRNLADFVNVEEQEDRGFAWEPTQSVGYHRHLKENDVGAEQENDLLHPKTCHDIVQRMHDWNDCWRRHVRMSHGQPWKNEITCLIEVQQEGGTTRLVTETIGQPLYQFAFYAGQGFGQFVQHVNSVCMFAFLLKRPCLINKAPRDPNNNWGSFITENTYHWEPAALHAIPDYANQLEALASKLPKMGHGRWGEDAIDENDYEQPEALVFPLERPFGKGDWEDAIDYYSGTHRDHGNKVLFAPNWGDAYKVNLTKAFSKRYDCDANQLESLVQNALFRPTDLSLELHQERYERAEATVWNPEEKANLYNERKKTPAPVSGPLNPAVRTGPHLSITGTVEDIPEYGTIHMRTFMINSNRKPKPPIEAEELADKITACLVRAQELVGDKEAFPDKWWFISDNAPTAVEVEEEFQKRRDSPEKQNKKSTLPALKIFHDYKEIAERQLEAHGGQKVDKHSKDYLPSMHSLSKASTGLYGHEHMAGSIMDWVALHESKIAIVTGATGYGTTGSRGHGKSVAAYCGNGMPDHKKQIFKILIEKK